VRRGWRTPQRFDGGADGCIQIGVGFKLDQVCILPYNHFGNHRRNPDQHHPCAEQLYRLRRSKQQRNHLIIHHCQAGHIHDRNFGATLLDPCLLYTSTLPTKA
jgi:hypothetical protein